MQHVLNSDAKGLNKKLLFEIVLSQKETDEDYVSPKVINNALVLVDRLVVQPEIFKTNQNSLHLQFNFKDNTYVELEVFENRLTCMIVPKRVYDNVQYPEVSLSTINTINTILSGYR